MKTKLKLLTVLSLIGLLSLGGYAVVASAQMGPMGPGMMGPMGGMGMVVCPGSATPTSADTPLTIDQAAEIVQGCLLTLGNPDLILAKVIDFTNTFYASVKEESTGIYAFELLIDKFTQAVYLEPGPTMMWNTKYGHMSGWGHMGMGRTSGEPTAEMPVTAEQCRGFAQAFLDVYLPGTAVADRVDTFYGYYTIPVLVAGPQGGILGLLSVNGYTGQVWYHTWLGAFAGIKEF